MVKGVEDFQGIRLQKALDARMFSATTLSELSGISSSMISQLINGKKAPSYETLNSIAKTLNLPETYFLKEYNNKEFPVFYRKFSSATKSIRKSVDVKLDWLSDLFDYVEKFVELPKLNFPDIDLINNKEFHNLSNLEIEEIADEARQFWGLGKG
uniref:helix-turn-helix domain-containing protein n=1 Tax=Gracilimonas tropica TaxID=454600 RepID=UPI00036BBCF1